MSSGKRSAHTVADHEPIAGREGGAPTFVSQDWFQTMLAEADVDNARRERSSYAIFLTDLKHAERLNDLVEHRKIGGDAFKWCVRRICGLGSNKAYQLLKLYRFAVPAKAWMESEHEAARATGRCSCSVGRRHMRSFAGSRRPQRKLQPGKNRPMARRQSPTWVSRGTCR